MPKAAALSRISFSPVGLAAGLLGILIAAYIGLIAVIMSYAALTVEFAESLRSEEAAVAALEAAYLSAVADINDADYRALGYTAPLSKTFVQEARGTALR